MMIEQLYNKHKQDLDRFARALARNEKEAEDLLQETFVRALAHSMQLGTLAEYKQRAWLYKVLRNIFYDRRRKEKFEVALEQHHDPADDIDFRIGIEINELLHNLPPNLHDIVYKRFYLGMTSKQIAGLLGIPHATARYRLHTALNLLRDKMKAT